MRQMLRALLALFMLAPLAACGFTPMYATGGGNGDVYIEQIDGRGGHALRKALMEQLAPGLPGLEGSATLSIELNERLNRLTFKPDEAASRTDAVAEAKYVLVLDGNAISGKIDAETTFNVPDAPFADIAAQTDASDRVMSLLARRIVDDLRIKLANQK